jgi:hypothetical protein
VEQGEAAATQGVAGFSPLERRMLIPSNFNSDNALQFLEIYHETVHIMHTAYWLLSGEQGFVEFYTHERPSVILDEEFDAYAVEIETLNLLLNGALKEKIVAGQALNSDEVTSLLALDEDQKPTIGMLLRLAEKYYPDGKISAKPLAFMAQVAANQLHYGYDLFKRGSDNQIIPILVPRSVH